MPDSQLISDKFVDKYRKKNVPWGYNGLGYIVYKRTYSRQICGNCLKYDLDEGVNKEMYCKTCVANNDPYDIRLEEWPETIQRCLNGSQKIGADYTKEEAERLFDYIFNLKCIFGGRMLWQLGTTTVDRFGANSLLNCFGAETEIITDIGIKKIGDLENQTVKLMTEYGKWVEAPIQSFGKQALWEITLKRGSTIKNICATANHQWFRRAHRSGEERALNEKINVQTIELREGDRLVSTFGQSIKNIVKISEYGIQHGLVFGDGSVSNNVAQITLCGKKNVHLLRYFPNPTVYNADQPNVIVGGLPKYFKNKPDLSMDKSYLYGWLAGYFAADGCFSLRKSGSKNARICSANRENLELVRGVCSKLGIAYSPIHVQMRNGYGNVPSALYSIALNCANLTPEFFLQPHHRQLFEKKQFKKPADWKIVSIKKTNRKETVFCAVVPEIHSFVLEGNILTGNCWAVQMNELKAFEFLFENLMLGGGVGFSVRREDVHELPRVKNDVKITHLRKKDTDFIVPDSREGWVKLLHHVLEAFFITEKSFTYSTLLVRGAGEPIKGFGGKSSGPQILVDGIDSICKIIQAREGKKLRSVDVLDIANIIGSIVVSGNVRRSAQIALGDPDDILFLRAKRWDLGNIPTWRSHSNNTIYADDYDHIMEHVWDGYGGNGEPYGFFNLPLSKRYGRLVDGPLKESNRYPTNEDNCVGLNPCIIGDTLIAVADGRNAVSIKQLTEENKDIPVYCQDLNASLEGRHKVVVKMGRNPRLTGYNLDVYKVTLDDGSFVKATDNHQFMMRDGSYKELKNLQVGDSLMPFNTEIQNGYITINSNGKYWKRQFRLLWEFLNKRKQPKGYHLHHQDFNKLNDSIDNLQLITIEDHQKIHDISGDNNPMRRFPEKNWRNDPIKQQQMREKYHIGKKRSKETCLNISRAKKGKPSSFKGKHHTPEAKEKLRLAQLKRYYNHKIVNIEYAGKENVYNLTVDDNHNYMIVTAYKSDKSSSGICLKNCGEITLASYESCNLCEMFLNNIESQDELIDCAKLLYKTQKAINALPFIHEETTKIVHKNMRIGLGVGGVCQSIEKMDWLDKCYKELRKFDKEWSKEKGWPESIKLTTVKPSGTVSLLSGASPGAHAGIYEYYIRRVRMSSSDPLIGICKELGYKNEYAVHQDGSVNRDTMIVEFPCKTEKGILAKDFPAIKQLDLVKQLQTVWADNAVSVTVYYKKEELPDIKNWLKENYKNSLKSVSFLLHQSHGFLQAPYEEITKENYEELISKIKPIKSLEIGNGHSLGGLECSGGTCPIK
jgi:ribonucleotide reductase alpha subunit